MKSILYAGAALMIGASVYGVVDYSKSTRNKDFKTLYKEEKAEVVTKEAKATGIIVAPEKKVSPVKKTKTVAPVVVKTSNKEFTAPVESIQPEKATVDTEALAETDSEEKYKAAKKRKKLNKKMFSRGGMKEEYYIEEPKPAKGKKTTSKEL